MGSKRVPEVRFKGFSGEWEERKLEEVANVYDGTHQTPKYKNEGVMFLSVENIKNLKSSKYISEEAFNKEFKIRPEKNDVLMTRIGDIGTANVVDEDIPIAYYVSLALFKSQLLNPYFLQANIHAPTMQKELWRKTLHIAFPKKINKNEISKIPFLFTSLEEQMKIGYFFKKLDETIAIQQQELDILKQTKQGFLQKMFPKEGESVPEIRFSGFSGEWEERKFFDNINSIIDFRGRTPKKLGLDWSKSGYLALSALNVKNGYIDLNVDAYYGDEELYKKWMGDKELKQGQVLFTTEAPMGNVAQVPDNKGYILSQRTIAFDVDGAKITDDFLSTLLRSPIVINKLYSMSSGGTAKGVSQKSLSKFKIVVPKSLDEQTQIGNFFKLLDKTIALHQKELDILKQTKKAFLQKMFV
ncbi:restriction endonuclease subunit S [Bacillus sp. FJAT-53060]|uniref:restriction endonuclease subunit S n=1 Tax=Bacillus sp. FJAT-53060 TaxID=3127666 RepID=UPI003013F7F1